MPECCVRLGKRLQPGSFSIQCCLSSFRCPPRWLERFPAPQRDMFPFFSRSVNRYGERVTVNGVGWGPLRMVLYSVLPRCTSRAGVAGSKTLTAPKTARDGTGVSTLLLRIDSQGPRDSEGFAIAQRSCPLAHRIARPFRNGSQAGNSSHSRRPAGDYVRHDGQHVSHVSIGRRQNALTQATNQSASLPRFNWPARRQEALYDL